MKVLSIAFFSVKKAALMCVVALLFASIQALASQGWTECMGLFPDKSMLPFEHPKNVRICRSGVIAISYDGGKMNPAFSTYYITPNQAKNTIPGREGFYEDPDLKAMGVPQAKVSSKAFGEDWNRGHLAPNRIMSFSTVGKKACFSMANIAPQGGYFNQQPWERTETNIAKFIAGHIRGIYIMTGVSYNNRASPRRGVDNIAVPNHYWTVICDTVAKQSAGFFGVNEIKTATLTSFVPVSQIEKMYGGRLFNAAQCNTGAVNRKFWWSGPDNLAAAGIHVNPDGSEVEVIEDIPAVGDSASEERAADRGAHAGAIPYDGLFDEEIAKAVARAQLQLADMIADEEEQ